MSRTKQINVRLTEDQFAVIDELATAKGINLQNCIRSILLPEVHALVRHNPKWTAGMAVFLFDVLERVAHDMKEVPELNDRAQEWLYSRIGLLEWYEKNPQAINAYSAERFFSGIPPFIEQEMIARIKRAID